MTGPEWTLDGFAPATEADWRALIDKDLKGQPFEKRLVTRADQGIQIQPLYTRASWTRASEREASAARGGSARVELDIRQRHEARDPAGVNAAVLDDLRQGATSIALRFDRAIRAGQGEGFGQEGAAIHDLEGLRAALDGVWLDGAVIALEAGAGAVAAAAAFGALLEDQGEGFEAAGIDLGVDPLGVLAEVGVLEAGLEGAVAQLAAAAAWASGRRGARAARVDAGVYHDAGADAAQELAFAVATGLFVLRGLCGAGLSVEQALGQIGFSLRVDSAFFMSMAKLRAFRILWARVGEACGAVGGRAHLSVEAGQRGLTRRDPHVNALRNTVAVFAAAVGGADAVISVAFDATLGEPGELGRRLARNTPIILERESHLGRVSDPAGGAWFIESLTDELAERAWGIFQHIEGLGGMDAALVGGQVAAWIEAVAEPRARAVASRSRPITGVSEFPNIHEVARPAPAEVAAIRDPRAGAAPCPAIDPRGGFEATIAAARVGTIGALQAALDGQGEALRIAPLPVRRDAEPFERLRDRGDAAAQSGAGRPRIFSANLGAAADYTARATFAANLLEAGGFEVIQGAGLDEPEAAGAALAQAGAEVAVICSSDAIYEVMGVEACAALARAGARVILLAGRPGGLEGPLRAAGLSGSLYLGCDALALLGGLWDHVEGREARG